ncbi:MAG TPA: ABC transporter substrate-binding protein [Amycolatopsis sp.]|nr:ABC transporter substrate-binding protein [Amycolatopsis sp.]
MSSRDVAPLKVGFLDEGLTEDPQAFAGEGSRPLRMRFDEALSTGELDRPVELVVRRGVGLPRGTAKAVQDAWHALADDGCLVILGPGITDNCIAVTPLFETRGVPTINFPGTTLSRGLFGFQYQLGALYWDGPLIAGAMARAGLHQIAVIRDKSPIGAEYFDYFSAECEHLGISIARDLKCSPVADDLTTTVEQARAAEPDALVYLGFGGVLGVLSRALTAAGWSPPRFTTTAGMHFYTKTPDEREQLKGWVYVDQVDERNTAYTGLQDRYEQRFGERPVSPLTGALYDLATLAVLGLRNATVRTPDGVREGLERIHQVPAALGGPGTVMGFGPWERTALKGKDYLVLRQMDGQVTRPYE